MRWRNPAAISNTPSCLNSTAFRSRQDAHWKVTRTKVKNVGKAIQNALRDIEKANPDTLYGVFGDAQWTNKDRLPDQMLRDLIEHFSSQTLSLANCPEDELGVGYEFLIKKFADDSGHTAAEFYTNRTVVHLMTEMLKPKPGESDLRSHLRVGGHAAVGCRAPEASEQGMAQSASSMARSATCLLRPSAA